MKAYIGKYISDNKKSISILLMCLVVGLVAGLMVFQFLNEGTRNELVNSIHKTLDLTKQEGFEGINVIKNGLFSNFLMLVLLYLSAITLIAPGLVCIIDGLKGFTLGLYISSIFQVFGVGNGILVTLLLVVLVNIVYLPAFLYLCCNAIHFHYSLTEGSHNQSKLGVMLKEGYFALLGFSVMFLSVIMEQFLSLAVICIYQNMKT